MTTVRALQISNCGQIARALMDDVVMMNSACLRKFTRARTKLFDSITCDPDHKLHEFLSPRNICESNLRRKRNFNVPLAKTKRLMNTFIHSNCD